MQKKFGVLRFAASVFKVLGILWGIIVLIACALTIVAASAGPQVMNSVIGTGNYVDMGSGGFIAGLFGALLVLVFGLIGALCIYALGELINLLVAVEENTRASALALVKERGQAGNG
jgi:hypothetical protein